MILVLNSGSSSLKYKLFSIGKKVIFENSYNNLKKRIDFLRALNDIKFILAKETKNYLPIDLIAHRVVHGGELESPFLISNRSQFLKIEKFNELAPLHNPIALTVIKESQKIFKNIKQVAVFDNAFFRELPEISQTLPINQKVARRLKIYRYGFHGISHQYVKNQVDPENKYKVISIHLGAGSSMAAIDRGKPLETSMSFTPSDGLMMQTRSGGLDPGVVFYLIRKLGINRAEDLLLNHSGIAGFTEGADIKTVIYNAGYKVEDAAFYQTDRKRPDADTLKNSRLALDKFVYEIRKSLAAYDVVLNGANIIAFTGRVGFGSSLIRRRIIKDFHQFKNKKFAIIEPNEELAIFEEVIKKGYL